MDETSIPTGNAQHQRDIDTLVEWARFSRGATTWRSVEESLTQVAPKDVASALERLRDTKLSPDQGVAPLALVAEWRSGHDQRETDILTHRLLRLGSSRKTLDELGQMHNVTRERVRQIETRLLKRLREILQDERYRPVRWALFQLEAGLGALAPDSEVPIGGEATAEADTFRLLLHVSGYVHDEQAGVIRHSDFQLPPPEDLPLLDDGPLIDESALLDQLTVAGVAATHLDFAVGHVIGVRRLEGSLVLWPRNIAHKGAAVLALRGRPMTPDDIADVIDEGFNRRGFRDRLFNEPRVMRSSRHHVALRTWELPEYGGVVPAMIERLSDGPAVLSELAQELATAFGISPNSVMMYSAAPIFRTRKGAIEMRPADDPFVPTNAPAKVAGLYRHDTDRLAWHVRVDRDVLRGSGRAVPDEIGVFLAGAPPLSLKLTHAGKDIPFGWPETSHVGPSIGSIRELALSAGSQEGDLLRLVFDRTDHSIEAHLVDTSTEGDPAEVITRLTGLDAHHLGSRAAFARSIGTDDDDPVDVLRQRNDHVVADLVDTLPAH